ncbi:Outer membrane vitamin B12 receptor BtuB [Hyphomicrobium sulfonivorans]|uniref:Outer membrane vitamin B12 receptor BtuB n=1 Tax=Hyphomicrobium sulfonivorans TaxID=121290 RepID=A0A120CWJ4_HYPSL|nr:TonB-dependent receptor [Hyphomicrobium sulfonivorans]KWT69460.1 Outer membrane vitamin B12 receptor BtuB [Hyphomicrobium sulfonivorans]
MYLRIPPKLCFGVLTALSASVSTAAIAQTAATPAPTELPTLEVATEQPKKKAAKAKSAKKAASKGAQPSAPAPAATQAAASSRTGDGDTRPGLNLDAPATTSSRLGLTPLETPASVEVIPGSTTRQRGQQNVNEAVTQNATGFTSAASPGNGGTSLVARGFAGHSSVMRLYDGTRLFLGNGTITFPFDTWSAERIEVLRGPASVMYGEGAIGGAINVVPKKPTDYFAAEGEVGFNTNGERRFGLGVGGPASDRISYRFDASGTQSDGWLQQEGDYSSLALSGAVAFRATDDLKFTLSHDYGYQKPMRYFGTPLVNGKIPASLRDKNYNVRDSKISYIDHWTQFKTEWNPTEWFQLRNVTYRITSERHWRNVEGFQYNPGTGMIDRPDGNALVILHGTDQIGTRTDATFRSELPGGMKNAFVAGFELNRINHGRDNNSPYGNTGPVDPFNPVLGYFPDNPPTTAEYDARLDQYAVFAENHLEVSKELSIIAGIRFDQPTVSRVHHRNAREAYKQDFEYVTWRAGAVYSPIKDLAFYGQYSTGVDPMNFGLVSLTRSQAAWEPTTGRQIEVGVKQSLFGGRGEWTFAAYDIVKKNLLSVDPKLPNSGIQRQVGQQSSRGVELSVAMQLTDTVRYEGNIALLKAEYDEFIQGTNNYSGKRPNNVPQQISNNWLSWAFLPDWEARVGVQWIGAIYNNDANTSKRPASTVVNLGLDYHVDERSMISLRGYNVFDEVYAYSGNIDSWQLAPPRSGEIVYRMKY